MVDKRTHRGAGPEDAILFGQAAIAALRGATEDYSLLLGKGYAQKSSLKLVGDRFELTERQRTAVMRGGCSDEQLKSRLGKQANIESLRGRKIVIDGYNILITIESALSGGYIFRGRDGCLRDLASIHGTYRRVTETIPAIKLAAGALRQLGISQALWLFDSPVSNSGRLKTIINELAEQAGWNWQVELWPNPDAELIASNETIVTSDSDVLDKCKCWMNLAEYIITNKIPSAKILNLSA